MFTGKSCFIAFSESSELKMGQKVGQEMGQKVGQRKIGDKEKVPKSL